MSAVASQEVLTPILLRSTTPAPSEKVMKYLQGMTREGDEPDNRPPRSVLDSEEYRSNMSAVRSPPHSPRSVGNRSGHMSSRNGDIDEEDADSNFQEGRTSEIDVDLEHRREPGPDDLPGPKYASYDSGPSFGNFGPLPTDDGSQPGNPYGFNSWNPHLSDIMGSPNGQTANTAANIPLPPSEFVASPRAPSARMDGQSTRARSQAPMSPKPSERAMSPKSTTRSNGRGLDEARPLSPMSVKSKATARTRGTEKGTTVYPPLPESRYGEGESNWDIGSPRSRAFSKAPSISPSDSPSNFKPPKSVSNGVSRPPVISSPVTNHQSRPFSPYRHGPTHADLFSAAARSRSLVIPEVDEPASSEGRKTPVAVQSQISKAPSQTNGKAPSQAPTRVLSPAPSQAPSRVPSQAPSQAPSRTPSQAPSQAPSRTPSHAPSYVSSHAPSHAPSQTPVQQLSALPSKAPTRISTKTQSQISGAPVQQPSMLSSNHSNHYEKSKERARSPTPEGLDPEEARIVADALGGLTPRTSYYADKPLEPEVTDHYHDTELCVLLHQEQDETLHELVRKALRKAIRQRVKRLGMKSDVESIKQFRKSYHDHNPSVHLLNDHLSSEEPPKWAVDLKNEISIMHQHLQNINENLRPQDQSFQDSRFEGDEYTRTPVTQTVNIQTQRTDDLVDSMYQNHVEHDDDNSTDMHRPQAHDVLSQSQDFTLGRDDSPGSLVLEKELYKLRQKPASQSGRSHRTWEVTRDDDCAEFDDDEGVSPSGLPTIPDTNGDAFADGDRSQSPPLPPIPSEDHEGDDLAVGQAQHRGDVSDDNGQHQVPPWQKIHQRLLNWAMIWPTTEFDLALNSTSRGSQVDEVALSIWATQTYKRYVRARLTEGSSGVDRLFVPPTVADVINNAVFNGRHGEACGMLKDLWTPFGLEGMPRLIIVLAKHRSEANHWVVHRFSLPEGKLATYDTYQDRTLPDGRPLGWWFAIRIAWPNAPYPSPESLVQKMIRLHRPMQLNIDNSVAAAGIWRNLLMGSRAERSLDLERLRDLINTEVKNLRQRKQLGKLSVSAPRLTWDEMGG